MADIVGENIGTCPNCGSENLKYQEVIIDSEFLYYPFQCMDCKVFGQEYYNVDYIYSLVYVGGDKDD
jgi:hypothetical protein